MASQNSDESSAASASSASSEATKWFVHVEGNVTGPFLESEIPNNVAHPQSLIWGRGMTQWLSFDKWKAFTEQDEETKAATRIHHERLWKVRVGTQELRPLKYDEMLEFLKSKADLSEITIFTEGYDTWKEVYQVHKIMDELGVSRRSHPRVPIMGTLELEDADGAQFTARILSISEGGLGMTEAPMVKIGDRYKILLKSPNLFNPVTATGDVIFVGNDGYAGVKFVGLHPESKSSVIEYVRKFSELNPGT